MYYLGEVDIQWMYFFSIHCSVFMPMTHAPETGTENWYHFLDSFFVPDETGSKISGLIFLYYCTPQFILKQ